MPWAEAQQRHSPDRLGDDRAVHLRGSGPAVAEDDRHLDHLEPGADRPVGHLHLEGVAARLPASSANRSAISRVPAGEPSSTISTWAEGGSSARAASTKASTFSASL